MKTDPLEWHGSPAIPSEEVPEDEEAKKGHQIESYQAVVCVLQVTFRRALASKLIDTATSTEASPAQQVSVVPASPSPNTHDINIDELLATSRKQVEINAHRVQLDRNLTQTAQLLLEAQEPDLEADLLLAEPLLDRDSDLLRPFGSRVNAEVPVLSQAASAEAVAQAEGEVFVCLLACFHAADSFHGLNRCWNHAGRDHS